MSASRLMLILFLCFAISRVVSGMQTTENPVYVDTSSMTWEMLQRARDQSLSNTNEAVRILQELLSDRPELVVPAYDPIRGRAPGEGALGPSGGGVDHFVTVRARVIEMLLRDPVLLARYQSLQQSEAATMLSEGRLTELAITRPLTPSGLEAMLQLAQMQLESGYFHAAIHWLDEARLHPNLLNSHAEHVWFMTALAEACLRNTPAADAAFATARVLASPTLARRYEAVIAAISEDQVAADAKPTTIHDHPASGQLFDIVAQPIWSVALNESLLLRRLDQSPARDDPNYQQMRQGGQFLAAAPTVWGDFVFVSEGHLIRAFNRLTGAELWRFSDASRLAAAERESDPVLDMNIIAVGEGALVTYTGHATSDRRSTSGRVVCLEPTTGRLRWMQSVARLEQKTDEEELFPLGQPIIADGSVFVLARRASRQNLTSCYLLALDLQTGSLRWVRHVSSTGGIRRGSRSVDSPVFDQGVLYLASPTGAIAAFDATTGHARWLRTFSVPMNPTQREQLRLPYEVAFPVVASDRVIALEPDQRRIAVLDRQTGQTIDSFPAITRDRFNAPAYLLGNDRVFVAVSDELRAFSVDLPGTMLWRLPATEQLQQSNAEGGATGGGDDSPRPRTQRLDIRGRVQLAGDRLLVPTANSLLIVNAETGLVEHELAPGAAANAVANGSQVFLAAADRLECYMSFRHARDMLQQRLTDRPGDAQPAMALMRLALQAGDAALAIDAAEQASFAVRNQPDTTTAATGRRELFEALAQAAAAPPAQTATPPTATPLADSRELGQRLHDIIASLAESPSERARQSLLRARWLQHHAPDQAAATLQELAGDTELAIVELSDELDSMIIPAGLRAQQQLLKLLRTPPTTPSNDEQLARRALAAAVADRPVGSGGTDRQGGGQAAGGNPAVLAAVAARYPLTDAAVDAAVLAAEAFAARGQTASAVAVLVDRLRDSLAATQRKRLLGSLADAAERGGWLATARDALEVAARRAGTAALSPAARPTTVVTLGGIERESAGWLASLRRSLGERDRPALGLSPGNAIALVGGVVPPVDHLARAYRPPTDSALLLDPPSTGSERTLRLIDVGRLNERWALNLHCSTISALGWFDDEPVAGGGSGSEGGSGAGAGVGRGGGHVLLWVDEQTAEPFAVRVDAGSGAIRWRSPSMAELAVEGPMSPDPRLAGGSGGGDGWMSGRAVQPLVVAGGMGGAGGGGLLVMVLPSGEVVAVDLGDGRTVRWRARTGLAQVRHAMLVDGAVVLAGAMQPEGAAASGGGRGFASGTPRRGDRRDPVPDRRESGVRVQAISVMDGSALMSVATTDGQEVQWVTAGPFGSVLYATRNEIGLIEIPAGRRRWANRGFGARDSSSGWTRGEQIVVLDHAGDLRGMDWQTGQMTEMFAPPRGDERAMQLAKVEMLPQAVVALYDQRLVVHHPTGRLIGADVVTDEREYQDLAIVRDMYVVMSRFETRPTRVSDNLGRRTEWTYRVYLFSENGQLLGPAIQLPPMNQRLYRVTAIDDCLLLSTLTHTVALPLPRGDAGRRRSAP